jgi:hypothetical protein
MGIGGGGGEGRDSNISGRSLKIQESSEHSRASIPITFVSMLCLLRILVLASSNSTATVLPIYPSLGHSSRSRWVPWRFTTRASTDPPLGVACRSGLWEVSSSGSAVISASLTVWCRFLSFGGWGPIRGGRDRRALGLVPVSPLRGPAIVTSGP